MDCGVAGSESLPPQKNLKSLNRYIDKLKQILWIKKLVKTLEIQYFGSKKLELAYKYNDLVILGRFSFSFLLAELSDQLEKGGPHPHSGTFRIPLEEPLESSQNLNTTSGS